MEQTFDLSALNKFLYQILVLTEEAKNALQSHCDEAIFSLKPWRMGMMVKQEVGRNACTCSKVRSLIILHISYNEAALTCFVLS